MRQFLTWKKILILGVLLVTPLALAQCGENGGESVSSHHVGPVGPTFPSGYYFDATVTPHSIPSDSVVIVLLRAWDNKGNPVAGAAFFLGGIDTVENPGVTGVGGFTYFEVTIEGGEGSTVFLTFTLEDSSLTLPVQIIAGVSE